MTNFVLMKSKMAASRPFQIVLLNISEILHDSWSKNFCSLILHISITYHRRLYFDSHIINPLITRATNKEIFFSAFQEKVSSRSSFYLANMHSNVSQWIWEILWYLRNSKTKQKSWTMHIEQNVRTRTRITQDKFRRNKIKNSQLAVLFNCFFSYYYRNLA